jgi:LppP/LprE lipoprotein
VIVAAVVLAPVALAATSRAPSRTQINAVMRRTVEVTDHSERFATLGRLVAVTVSDGHDGTLTAVLGTRSPTADGYGQLVFFWHNGHFIGWDSPRESIALVSLEPAGTRAVRVKYAHYSHNDPFCCPSLAPVAVTYRWNGSRLTASGPPPRSPALQAAVKLL